MGSTHTGGVLNEMNPLIIFIETNGKERLSPSAGMEELLLIDS